MRDPCREAYNADVANIAPGPYYAHWALGVEDLNSEIVASVRHVSEYVAQNGPFHAVMGFSQVCIFAVPPDHKRCPNVSSWIVLLS